MPDAGRYSMKPSPGIVAAAITLLLLLSLAPVCAPRWFETRAHAWLDDKPRTARFVAIGDVHGAYPEFIAILRQAGLIDGGRHWIDGASVLVQTGDAIDRGSRSRECLDLLMDLQRQAGRQNGRVVALLGNHEVMDMLGDVRYVSADDYHAFATPWSPKVREQAYQDYRKFLVARGRRLGRPSTPDNPEVQEKWIGQYRRGFFEYRDAFGPRGVYGRWLRQHDTASQFGELLFIHAGLSPALDVRDIEELNNRVRGELAAFDSLWQALAERKIIWRYMRLDEAMTAVREELAALESPGRSADAEAIAQMRKFLAVEQGVLMSADGPLWYRGYAQLTEEKLKEQIGPILERLKVQYLVAGHSPLASHRVTPRLGNHIFLIDTGMLEAVYGGQASALEFQGGSIAVYYPGGVRQVLVEPAAPLSLHTGAPQSNRGAAVRERFPSRRRDALPYGRASVDP